MLPSARKPRQEGKRAQQREATKRALLEAASALFAAREYDAVSVSDIAAAAGVSTSLINAHFGGKGGLLYALVTENNAPQLAAAERAARRATTAMGRLERVIGCYAAADLADPRLLAAMQAFSWTWPQEIEVDNAAQRQPHEALLAEIVRGGIDAGEFRPIDVDRAVTTIWAVYTWGLRAAVFDGVSPTACARRICDQLRDLLIAG